MLIPLLILCTVISVLFSTVVFTVVEQPVAIKPETQTPIKPTAKPNQSKATMPSENSNSQMPPSAVNPPAEFQVPQYQPVPTIKPKTTNVPDDELFHQNMPNDAAKFIADVSEGKFKGWSDKPVDSSDENPGPLDPEIYKTVLRKYLDKYENDPSSISIIEYTTPKPWGKFVEAGVVYRASNNSGVIQTKRVKFMFLDGKITNVPTP